MKRAERHCVVRVNRPASMATSADANIVVVGCGISGVAAAHRLVKAGFRHVRILEATGRSGGRIKTDKMGNTIVEIGASFLHGPSEENPVFRLARYKGLLAPESLTAENQAMFVSEFVPGDHEWFSNSGKGVSSEQMKLAEDMFIEIMLDTSQFKNKEEATWDSAGHFVRFEVLKRAAERWKDKDKTTRALLLCAISAMLKDQCISSAAPTMDAVDLLGFCTYKDLCGLDCTFPGGYESLIKSLMSELPCDLVTYSKPVHCIHWNNTESRDSTVIVECDDGERIAADHVILTVPLGYLKRHHSTLFSPPLPTEKKHSIQGLGFGTTNKIFIEFDSPWWSADSDVVYFLWEDEEDIVDHVPNEYWIRKISTFTVIKSSESPLLCGWIAGHESEHMESLTDQEILDSITELIRTFTGDPRITPKRIMRTQWFHHPWTCGSYFYARKGFSPQYMENLIEPLPTKGSPTQPLQVMFAGEATHPEFFSTVHGALLTGWREADRLISHYYGPSVPLKSCL